MSLSFPTLPDGLDLPIQYFVSLYVLKPSQVAGGRMQGTQVRALGQDTQLHSSRCSFGVEIMLQVGGPQATCMHVQYIGRKGRTTSIFRYQFYGIHNFKRKHGISGRQGKTGNQDTPVRGSQSSDLKVFFLPLMQYGRATRRGTLYITTHVRFGGFLYLYHGSSLHGL